MTKVMNIISDSNIGGAGRVIINYLKYADRKNFDISVVVPRGSKLIEPLSRQKVRVYEVDGIGEKSMSIGAIKALKEVIRRENPQIVHTHGSFAGRVAARQCGKKVVYTRHSAFPVKSYMKKGPGHWLNGLVNAHYADRIIAISPACRDNLTDSGVPAGLIDTMMNGVEPLKRSDPETAAEKRRELSIGENDFTAGIIARIEDYKGHMDILEAAKILKDRGKRLKVIVAGTGSYEENVRRRAKELGLDDRVIFTGFITDVSSVFSILDVQLNASWGTEASSLSIIEGFSLSVPVIASDYGGNPYMVEDGVDGLIFPARDTWALAERIERLMNDRALLEKLSRGAGESYRNKFTGEIAARKVEEVYKKVLE